jgi:hypothetical protein
MSHEDIVAWEGFAAALAGAAAVLAGLVFVAITDDPAVPRNAGSSQK